MENVLDVPTLVLNARWRAIGIDTVKESIKKMMKDSCKMMNPFSYETYSLEDWYNLDPLVPMEEHPVISAAKRDFVAPRVVLLTDYADMPKNEVRLTRRNVLIRDKFCCQYCGIKVARTSSDHTLRKLAEYTWDHVTPRSLGGKTTWTNIVTACFKCNGRKADRTVEKCGMKLLSTPVKPKWSLSLVRNIKTKPACWDRFLSKEVWNPDLALETETADV